MQQPESQRKRKSCVRVKEELVRAQASTKAVVQEV